MIKNPFYIITTDSTKKGISLFEMDMTENQLILGLPVDSKANMWKRLA